MYFINPDHLVRRIETEAPRPTKAHWFMNRVYIDTIDNPTPADHMLNLADFNSEDAIVREAIRRINEGPFAYKLFGSEEAREQRREFFREIGRPDLATIFDG